MNDDEYQIGDRVVTIPGPDFGYTWEHGRVGTVVEIKRYDFDGNMYGVVFDDEPESKPFEDSDAGWLLYPREIKHINNN